jgi:HD superfamily phosphohydrolase
MTHGVVIRDPLWDTIRVDPIATRIVNSPVFQRLRYIRQLGHAHLVYPGATHTRFDHALGVYNLAQRALASLRERSGLAGIEPADCAIVPLAALLHDVGHYPFSHALEELEAELIPGHHEALVGGFLSSAEVSAALDEVAPDGAARVEALIRGRSTNPLQGLVSGSLDLDKIEYLKRDARFCGVPYGEVDVDRLIYSLTLVADPASGRLEVGVHEKGVAALESLLFAKYQMFRNVYWHHAVRAATVMYKRLVADALEAGLITGPELVGQTDEGLLFLLGTRAAAADDRDAGARTARWTQDLRERRLPKRAGEVVAADLDAGVGEWLERESALKRAVEDRIAEELGLPHGAAFLDYPEKPAMFGLDLLVQRRGGVVLRLGPAGRTGLIDLPRVADELYRTARVLRLFTLGGRRQVGAEALAELATATSAEVAARIERGGGLLSGGVGGAPAERS